MAAAILTQDLLKSQLNYNPDTGIFTRKVSNSNFVKVGDVAGYADKDGYIIIGVCGTQYKAHRLAWLYMTGSWPVKHIDHINRKTGDNTFINLRECDDMGNNQNQGMRKTNSSGYRGVSYFKRDGTWMAMARAWGKRKFLGYYKTPEEASKAYQNFAKEQRGEFYNGV
jgi:HNH endonuclease/AP2 domain